jgi:hypothetical protein
MSESVATASDASLRKPAMNVFERFLTFWVALCIIAGITLGQLVPGIFRVIGDATVAQVNLPVAVLGPVDGFNQDEGAGKGDECAVAVLGFVTTHGNPLEALQLADGLLDSGTRLVEQSGKELRLVLGVLAIRNNRNDAAATASCPIGR